MNMIEKVLYLGLGVFSVTRERMEKVVNELIEKGELSREEARQVMDELIKRGEEEKRLFIKWYRKKWERSRRIYPCQPNQNWSS